MSVSTVAHNAYDNVLNLTATIGNIQDTSNDNTNGLFGKLMSVSTVAHNAYDDMIDLTGQFTNLSQLYYNTSTVNLSYVLWDVKSVLNRTNVSLYNVSTIVDSFIDKENFKNLNVTDTITIGNIENNNGNIFMLLNSSSNPIMRLSYREQMTPEQTLTVTVPISMSSFLNAVH